VIDVESICVGFLLVVLGCCLYDEKSAVKLTERNFKDFVLMADEYWFYGKVV
jgi:hypothetical protein